ncbi:MAG: fibronectin type III domain-containing protein [Thaumarchaeota archaeon]|nr:fibronectin type III domain-containing protein [Nitrososphaerota archaeon]
MDTKSKTVFVFLLFVAIFGVCTIDNAYAQNGPGTITPTKLNATAISPTQITLSWLPPIQNYGKIIIGYKIDKMIGGGVFDTVVDNTESTFPTYSMTGLTTGTTYTYRVSAVYSDDSSTDPSNWASVTPLPTSVMPANTTPNSSSKVNEKLDFTPADGTTLYGVVITQIDYQQLQERKESRSIIANGIQTAQSPNTDLNGLLKYENNHQTSSDIPAPLIVTAVSPTQIDLSWLPPEESYGQVIIGYKIEWKQAPGLYVTIEDNTHDVSTKYSVLGLTTGTTYTYRVSAVFTTDTISNPSNEASATPLASIATPVSQQSELNLTQTNTTTPNSAQSPAPAPAPTQTNIQFDFTLSDGTTLYGVILTPSEYQQLIVIKDPRSIIANVTQTTSTINNDLAGILKYQSIHTTQQLPSQQPPTNYTQPPTTPPRTGLDVTILYGVITSVVASGAVGIITWLVRTKIAKKIAKEYNFTIEKFTDDGIEHVRIRNRSQTIEDCTILCDKQTCVWMDTDMDKPRHIFDGSNFVVRLPTGSENINPLITVLSGKKVIRKTRYGDMAHGTKIDESANSL